MNEHRLSHDRTTSLRLPKEVYAKLEQIAERNWTNVSAVIRQGIRRELIAQEALIGPLYELKG